MSAVLEVRGLTVGFGASASVVRDVDWSVDAGKTLAVVGESGSGKSVTAMSVLRLLASPPTEYRGGSITFTDPEGGRVTELLRADARELSRVRGGRIAMIFQEPMTSLNPVMSIGEQLIETIRVHQECGAREAAGIAERALEDVGIRARKGVSMARASVLRAYPHEFSGGMRQRVMIAMAMACRPAVLLADEPTTALDVTTQRQVLDLLDERKRATGMAMVLISHDLGLVRGRADEVCVMYRGRVVERGAVAEVFAGPIHPYTRALVACSPRIDRKPERLATIDDAMADGTMMREFEARVGKRAWWPGGEGAVMECVAPGRWVAVAG
ncbi:MAG: ABC transporter ATP-binding protein [Phycisphaerales bacterium]|jgi:ABC-type dipeptide/oligopeptide/nickel transport system ATPase component|nr:ABC transporter ATP-binding protein [Phycisphaerales bacterium]